MNHTNKFAIIKGGQSAVDSNESSEPCANTVAFSCLTPEVFAAVVGFVQLLGCHLRWHKSTVLLVAYIACRLGGDAESVFCSQGTIGAIFFPRQSKKDQRKSAKRMLMIALADMQASSCPAFTLKPGYIKHLPMKGHGNDRRADFRDLSADQYIESEYRPGVVGEFLNRVQERARENDLFALETEERNRSYYFIIQAVAVEMKFTPIEQAPDEPSERKKKKEGRITKQSWERGLVAWEEAGFELAQDGLNLGMSLPVVDTKLNIHATDARIRIRNAVARKSGATLTPDAALASERRMWTEAAGEAIRELQRIAESKQEWERIEFLRSIIKQLEE